MEQNVCMQAPDYPVVELLFCKWLPLIGHDLIGKISLQDFWWWSEKKFDSLFNIFNLSLNMYPHVSSFYQINLSPLICQTRDCKERFCIVCLVCLVYSAYIKPGTHTPSFWPHQLMAINLTQYLIEINLCSFLIHDTSPLTHQQQRSTF